MLTRLTVLVLLLAGGASAFAQEARYDLPRRLMPLEKAIIKLTEAGAEISYRPDQLPPLAVRVPGGLRTLDAWLSFLLRGTDLIHERTPAGYIIVPDYDLRNRTFRLYGTVTARESGELLIGAGIQAIPADDRQSVISGITNEYGFFSLPVRGGRQTLRLSYVGYSPVELDLTVRGDSLLNVGLRPNLSLPQVIVTAVPDSLAIFTESGLRIGREDVAQLGGPGGEADPLRLARLLPGVTSGADGVGGLFIRGSEAGHNLILLDGVPVYNLSHAAGLLSIFSNQAIKRVDLYKDAIPARFGGRIGGVLDIHTRDGNQYNGEYTVGSSLLSTQVTAEGPLEEGKSSFLLTGRYFWAGDLLRKYSRRYKEDNGRTGETSYQVYDINLKLNDRVSERGRVFFSFYRGIDDYSNNSLENDRVTLSTEGGTAFRYSTPRTREEDVGWANSVAALRYNHIFSDRLFTNFRLSFSELATNAVYERSDSTHEEFSGIGRGTAFRGEYGSQIRQLGIAFDGEYSMDRMGQLDFGAALDVHRFTPRIVSGAVDPAIPPEEPDLEKISSTPRQLSGYASWSNRLGELYYRLGLRGQLWRNGKDYLSFSPRVLVGGPLVGRLSWRLSFDRTVQPIHLLSSTIVNLPSDLWVPATRNIRPAAGYQYSGQLDWQPRDGWQLEAAVYYRNLERLTAFEEGGRDADWEESISSGRGETYGAEITLRRSRGWLRGWIGYARAESRRDFDARINEGNPFPFRYDRKHSINAIAIFQVAPRSTLTASWRFGSGAAYSLSTESIQIADPARLNPDESPVVFDIVGDRNEFRLPSNHRLDLTYRTTVAGGDRYKHDLSLGIYNVYNRHNPIYYDVRKQYYERNEQLTADRTFVAVYIAPTLPVLSYYLTFKGK